jgi:pilus assembly protein Flp/PilA
MSKINNWMLSKTAAWKARDEEGQGLAEYGLILALIAVACIVALTALGGGISTSLGKVTSKL